MPTRMDNEWDKFTTDEDGDVAIRTIESVDFFQGISEGVFPEYSYFEKFGENPDVQTGSVPEDVWDYGGLYTFSASANIDRLSSSNAGDTQDILVIGLDTNWDEVQQTITLTGQTPVALTTSLRRVYRMINVDSSDVAGNIYCFVNGSVTGGVPDTAADIRAMIRTGDNQTQMCIYTVPNGKIGYFWGVFVSVSRAGVQPANADFTWRARTQNSVFCVKSRVACISDGNSSFDYIYKVPLELPAKTDVLIRCENVSNTCGVAGGFTIVLKDVS